MPTELMLLGAGGHAKVVYDALQLRDDAVATHIADDNAALNASLFFDLRIRAPIDWSTIPAALRLHVCVGDNAMRQRLIKLVQNHNKTLYTVIHPNAIIAHSACVEDGVFIAAGSVVAPQALIGNGSIINHNAVVDHDSRVGAFSHIAPNATLGGEVSVGQHTLIGAGATVLPGICLGDHVTVGAGAVVTVNVAAYTQVTGIPARTQQR